MIDAAILKQFSSITEKLEVLLIVFTACNDAVIERVFVSPILEPVTYIRLTLAIRKLRRIAAYISALEA